MHLKTLTTCALANLAAANAIMNTDKIQAPMKPANSPSIVFSETWSVLGPFQIGTREAAWGADPLELYGGFPGLVPLNDAVFRSSLTPNGTVKWSSINAATSESGEARQSKISLTVGFPDIDWAFVQPVYGWSALQWQGWARGEFHVDSNDAVAALLYIDSVLEYALDGKRFYGGDFYIFRKAPHVIRLTPGKHVLDVRLLRDVRAMGGVGEPTIDLHIELQLCETRVEVVQGSVLVSDVLDGWLPSPYATFDIRNNGDEWIEVDVAPAAVIAHHVSATLLDNNAKVVAPGQTRPIVFLLQADAPLPLTLSSLDLSVTIRERNEPAATLTLPVSVPLTHKAFHSAHKLTHLHPSNIVSYALLVPPSPDAICPLNSTTKGAPIMLQLHGAGVEADSPMVYDVIKDLPPLCAWILFPSGVNPWSADDWHTFGFNDVLASITAIPSWIVHTGWAGVGVDKEKWFVGGHSNGGQGTWFTLLHHPDKVFAASPLSGYLSIQSYVPYTLWRPTIAPKKRAVLDATGASFHAGLLASNAKGIPVLIQHGGEDDNVPVYHSRLMTQLLGEAGVESTFVEVPGQGHWWDGVVTTDVLVDFYKEQFGRAHVERNVPRRFKVIVANPVDHSGMYGVRVLYLLEYGELGRVVVEWDEEEMVWRFETENVMALKWNGEKLGSSVVVDGMKIGLGDPGMTHVWRDESGKWTVKKPTVSLRNLKHFGGIDAILRTTGSFEIVYHDQKTFPTALAISRSLHQYFYADSVLVQSSELHGSVRSAAGNRISLSIGSEALPDLCSGDFPIQLCPFGHTSDAYTNVTIQAPSRSPKVYSSRSEALGAIFIRPLGDRLELVIWGSNAKMLARAARLAPTMTGMGAPDWIILSESASWRGAEGCAVGFFDARWDVAGLSSFTLR